MSVSDTAKKNGNSKPNESEAETSSKKEEKNPVLENNTDNTAQGIALTVKESSPKLNLQTPLPGNRPIDPSQLKIVETMSSSGIRPIAASNLQISETVAMYGMRPVSSSSLQVSETYRMSGNRPIAPNQTEDIDALLGYLD